MDHDFIVVLTQTAKINKIKRIKMTRSLHCNSLYSTHHNEPTITTIIIIIIIIIIQENSLSQ